MRKQALTFTEWMSRVSARLKEAVGIYANDLPDAPYRDWYDQCIGPVEAARRSLKLAKES